MNTLVLESEPSAIGVSVTDEELIVDLTPMAAVLSYRWLGTHACWMLPRPSEAIGNCWRMGMRWNGPTWMNILASKVCWQDAIVAKANNRSANG